MTSNSGGSISKRIYEYLARYWDKNHTFILFIFTILGAPILFLKFVSKVRPPERVDSSSLPTYEILNKINALRYELFVTHVALGFFVAGMIILAIGIKSMEELFRMRLEQNEKKGEDSRDFD